MLLIFIPITLTYSFPFVASRIPLEVFVSYIVMPIIYVEAAKCVATFSMIMINTYYRL